MVVRSPARTPGSRDWAQTHAPDWTEALRLPGAPAGDPERVWRTFEAPVPSTDGYRVIWVHSSGKAARDAAGRAARIEAGLAAIEALQTLLRSPKTRLKTKVIPSRGLFTTMVGLRLKDLSETSMVLGEVAVASGAHCHWITRDVPGTGYVLPEDGSPPSGSAAATDAKAP